MLDDRQKKFVGYLLSLAAEGQEDLGALADLRSGLGKAPGEMVRVHRHVVPFLPEHERFDRLYYLIATLFGLYPMHSWSEESQSNGRGRREKWTIGRAFGVIKNKSDSIGARFIALLNAHVEDLGDHLRHVISLLKANDIPIDWFQLFDDVLKWDEPEKPVQLKWARHFYMNDAETDMNEASQN